MSPELVAIVAAAVALAGLNLGLSTRLKHGLTRLEDRMLAVEKEQARTSGLLEGLGLTGRATPAPPSGADWPRAATAS